METKVQYPEWQIEMRRLQNEQRLEAEAQDRANAERNAQQEHERLAKIWQESVVHFRKIGFTAYPAKMPKNLAWQVDGYIFKLSGDNVHFYVCRDMPKDGLAQLEDDYEDLHRYRDYVEERSMLSRITLAQIADMIDDIDRQYERQLADNQDAIASVLHSRERWEKQRAEAVEKEPPSVSERLAELIREIVREEMGVVRDSQFESYL